MRKLLKIFGIGFLTGAGTKAGCWLMDRLLRTDFGSIWDRFRSRMGSDQGRYLERTDDERG